MTCTRSTTAYVLLGALIAGIFLFGGPQVSVAQFNQEINYQGKLNDNAGVPVTDGDYEMHFRLYTVASGGSDVWDEVVTVTVTNGLFSHLLGSSSTLSGVDFNQDLYLGVAIRADGEMTPRKQLGAVPAAFEALNTQTFDDLATTSFLRSDQDDTATGLLTFSGGLIANSSSTINNLTTTFATTTNLIINNQRFTDLLGFGLTNASNALTVDTTVLDTRYASTTNFDTEAELETLLTNVTNVFTNNDGALSDDDLSNNDTDDLVEGSTNQYFTNTRARSALSETIDGITYTSGTGVFSLTSGYSIPLSASTTNWNTFYDTPSSRITAGTDLAWSGNTLNYTGTAGATDFLSLTDTPGSFNADRIPFTNSAGTALTDSADFSFDGTTLVIGGMTIADGLTTHTGPSTTTVPANNPYAWTISTGVGTEPLFRIDTTTGQEFVNIGNGTGDVLIGDIGSSADLVFEESATISAQGENTLTMGIEGDTIAVGASFFGIGTSTPSQPFTIATTTLITSALLDRNASAGTNGMVLQTTSDGVEWVATSSLGILGTTDFISLTDTPSSYNANRILFQSGAAVVDSGDLTFDGSTLNVGGNITLSGTVDGRDVDADGTKLDGIESGADVTDTANVTAAGALMDSEVDADLQTFVLPANTTISAFGASLVDDADNTAARTTLGLGSLATLNTINNSNWSGADLAVANGGTGASDAAGARTNLGATTVGANLFTLTDPSAIRFLRVNADNTVDALDAATFRTAIGAGSGGGSVTSVDASGGTTGLTFSGGPITNSGTLTLAGTLGVTNGGTGTTTAAGARTNLGLVIGTDVQAWDADLDTWATVTPSANGQSLVSAADYAAMRTLLDLEAGTDFYSIAAADTAFEGELDDEAGLYAALSDVTDFYQPGEALDSGSITSGFGNIDIGSSNLDADGTITFGGASGGLLVTDASGNLSTTTVGASDLADGDFGDFTVSGGVATLDTNVVGDNEIDYAAVTLADFDNTGTNFISDITSESFVDLFDTPGSFTANRLLFTNSGGTALTDSADLTFNGNTLSVDGAINIAANNQGYGIEGVRVLYSSTSLRSVMVGNGAGANLAGSNLDSVAIGFNALDNATTDALFNTAIGRGSLGSLTTGDYNIAIGRNAAFDLLSGLQNVAIGDTALGNTTSGDDNVAIGRQALEDNITGSDNIAIGYLALGNATNTGSSVAIGYQASRDASAANSVAIGYQAGVGAVGESYQNAVLVGYRAGESLAEGADNNLLIGFQAANSLTTGANNIVIGNNVEAPSNTADNQLNIGNLIFGTGIDGTGTTLSSGNIGIGTTSPSSRLTVDGSVQFASLAGGLLVTDASGNLSTTTVGASDLADGDFGDFTVSGGVATLDTNVVGDNEIDYAAVTLADFDNTGTNFISDITSESFVDLFDTPGSFTANRLLFTNSGGTALTDSADLTFDGGNLSVGGTSGFAIDGNRILYASSSNLSTLVGDRAGDSLLSDGNNNVALGYRALTNATSSDNNTAIGFQSMLLNEAGYENTAVGYFSLQDNIGGYQNAVFGASASGNNTSGFLNTSVGYAAASTNTTGGRNTAIGGRTLDDNDGGDNNTAVGYAASRYNTSANDSVALGYQAARGTLSLYNASNYVALGAFAGRLLETGADNNILIGYQAADSLTTGANNIVIGYDVEAPSNTADNQLNIGNLIFGTGIDGTGTTLSSGNIGIGTSTPASKLTVLGTNDLTGGIRIQSTTGNPQRLGIFAGGLQSAVIRKLGGNASLSFQDNAGDSEFTLNSSGDGVFDNNVGIGGTPSYRFHVVSANNNAGVFESTDPVSLINLIDPSGDVQIGIESGTMFFGTTSALTGSAMSILENGNVGIGTTSPTRTLSIAGDMSLTGALYDSTDNVGTNGMILQTTGSGTQWVATSSLGISGGGSSVTFGADNQLPFMNGAGTDFEYDADLTFDGSQLTLGGTGLSLSGSTANIALGSNFLSGDGDDEGIFVDASGNVGIGTTTPAAALQIESSGTAILVSNGVNTPVFRVDTTYGISGQLNNNLSLTSLGNNDDEGVVFQGRPSDAGVATEYARLVTVGPNAGYFGLGTDAPDAILDLSGTDPDIHLQDTANGGLSDPHSGAMTWRTGSNSIYATVGYLNSRQLLIVNEATGANSNIELSTEDDIRFDVGGGEFMRIDGGRGGLGIGTTTPESILALQVNELIDDGVAGIDQYINTTNTVADAVQYGNRFELNLSNVATTTSVGSIYRISDDTSFGNTVRGLEVQADRGTNTQGENTALSGFARTFGVRGFSSGDAGGLFEPAGGFFETGGTTQGNAIRGFSSTITGADLFALKQETSAFTGNGILMDFGTNSGSFTGNFIDAQVNGVSQFSINNTGSLLLSGSNPYINFGSQAGASGYGLRDQSGTLQFRNNGGDWANLGTPLSTTAGTRYDISAGVFDDEVLDVSGEDAAVRDLLFNNDGTVLYILGSNTDSVYAYNLFNPYDPSTAGAGSVVLDISGEETEPYNMVFNNDGTALYIVGETGDDINEYILSTPYDISSVSSDSVVLDISALGTEPRALLFNNDGTVLYVLSAGTGDDVEAYDLSTPYDPATASSTGQVLDISGDDSGPMELFFNDDGTVLYLLGTGDDDVTQYTLSTAYDISTAGAGSVALDISAEEEFVRGGAFNGDGSVFYTGASGGFVRAWNLDNFTSNNVFVTDTTANFGIGTDNPTSKLTVAGDILISGSSQASNDLATTTQTSIFDFGTDLDANYSSVRAMIPYQGDLYFGTFGASAGTGDLLRWDGSTTTEIYEGVDYESILSMAVYDNKLYFGTGYSAGDSDVLVYDGSTVSTTTGIRTGNELVEALTVFEDRLYALSTGLDRDDSEIYRLDEDGINWTSVHDDNSYDLSSSRSASGLIVHDGVMYAAYANFDTGADDHEIVFFTTENGDDWDLYGVWDGPADAGPNTDYVRLLVFDDEIYFSLYGDDAGDGGVMKLSDINPANGEAGQDPLTYTSAVQGVLNMFVYNGALHITEDGGNIYRLSEDLTEATLVTETTDDVIGVGEYKGDLYFSNSNDGIYVVDTELKSTESYGLNFAVNAGVDNNAATGTIWFTAKDVMGGYFDDTTGLRVDGQFMMSHSLITNAGAYDVAEDYPTNDSDLEVGIIMQYDTNNPGGITRATDPTMVTGITSGEPGFLLSQEDRRGMVPMALVGRVPVKVTNDNGDIVIGDSIALSSSTDGYGMAARFGDKAVGYALEEVVFDTNESSTEVATGTVMVYLSLHTALGAPANVIIAPEASTSTQRIPGGEIMSRLRDLAAAFVDGILTITGLKAERVETTELCVGETCVDEATLKALLSGTNRGTSTGETNTDDETSEPTDTDSETETNSETETASTTGTTTDTGSDTATGSDTTGTTTATTTDVTINAASTSEPVVVEEETEPASETASSTSTSTEGSGQADTSPPEPPVESVVEPAPEPTSEAEPDPPPEPEPESETTPEPEPEPADTNPPPEEPTQP